MKAAVVLAIVLASGFSGLIYELVFIRLAVLVFGSTVEALSTVVSAYVAGLAAGSYLSGRLADRVRSPLLVYGLLEGLVGLYCLGLPLYFGWVTRAYPWLHELAPDSALWITTSRVLLSGAVVLVPTMMMGASMPLLARHAIQDLPRAGSTFSRLYGSNTLGAAAGVCASTYWLIPSFGLPETLAAAVAINLTIAVVVALGHRRLVQAPSDAPLAAPVAGLDRRLTLAAAFLSGYLVFSLEVVWSHLLHLTVGGSEYAVGAILFAVLVALGAGSALAGRVMRVVPDERILLGALLALSGLTLALEQPLWNRIPQAFLALEPFDLGFQAREAVRFAMTVACVSLPSLVMGMIFPLCVKLALPAGVGSLGSSVGRIYAVNAIGSIIGPIVAGFALLPRLGSFGALRAHGLAYLALGVAVIALSRGSRARSRLTVLGAAAVGVVLLVRAPAWDPRAMTSGANVYFTRGFSEYDRLLHQSESVPGGVTSVIEKNGERTLLTNGKFQGTTSSETSFQINMALVPMAFLADFGDALNIGLGTGQTLATMTLAPFRRLDVAEISLDIVTAARRFFATLLRGALDDPRVRLQEVDGRNFLLLHPERRYDLITIQISSIWLAGAASLYNREFYELCRARLMPSGVLQQWLQLHHMRFEDQLTVIRTMAAVFPHTSLWRFGHQAVLLGSQQPLTIDYQRSLTLERSLQAKGALDHLRDHRLLGVLAYHHLGDQGIRDLLHDAPPSPISSDMHPTLAYGSPKGVVHPGSAAEFYRATSAYGFTPLDRLLRGASPADLIRVRALIERELER